MRREVIIKKLDRLSSYYEKLEYLNGLYLKAKTTAQEILIEELIKRLKNGF